MPLQGRLGLTKLQPLSTLPQALQRSLESPWLATVSVSLKILAHQRQGEWQPANHLYQPPCHLRLTGNQLRSKSSQQFQPLQLTKFGDREDVCTRHLERHIQEAGGEQIAALGSSNLASQCIFTTPGIIKDKQEPSRPNRGAECIRPGFQRCQLGALLWGETQHPAPPGENLEEAGSSPQTCPEKSIREACLHLWIMSQFEGQRRFTHPRQPLEGTQCETLATEESLFQVDEN